MLEPLSAIVAFSICLPALVMAAQRSTWLIDYLFFVVVLNRGIRRMVDYQNGEFNSLSLISLTPIIVGGLATLVVLIELNGSRHHAVGVMAKGTIDNGAEVIYEIDYCSLSSDDITGGLVIDDDGNVAKAFPSDIWLGEDATEIESFYVLYLIKSGRNAIITSVEPFGAKDGGRFKNHEGFLVK